MIEIAITVGSSASEWIELAGKQAKEIAKERGLDWKDVRVVVYLPVPGISLTKRPGFEHFTLHGA